MSAANTSCTAAMVRPVVVQNHSGDASEAEKSLISSAASHKEHRKFLNRINAKKSRDRKRVYTERVTNGVSALTRAVALLSSQIAQLSEQAGWNLSETDINWLADHGGIPAVRDAGSRLSNSAMELSAAHLGTDGSPALPGIEKSASASKHRTSCYVGSKRGRTSVKQRKRRSSPSGVSVQTHSTAADNLEAAQVRSTVSVPATVDSIDEISSCGTSDPVLPVVHQTSAALTSLSAVSAAASHGPHRAFHPPANTVHQPSKRQACMASLPTAAEIPDQSLPSRQVAAPSASSDQLFSLMVDDAGGAQTAARQRALSGSVSGNSMWCTEASTRGAGLPVQPVERVFGDVGMRMFSNDAMCADNDDAASVFGDNSPCELPCWEQMLE